MGSIVHVVVGGQFGSEAKGHVAHRVIRREIEQEGRDPGTVVSVRVGGPNAGHTVVDDAGRAWPLRTVPVGAATPGVLLSIAAGSEIEPGVLLQELIALTEAGLAPGPRLIIDPQVTVIEPHHKLTEAGMYTGQDGETTRIESESLVLRIGSTGKGIGAARAARAMRHARTLDGPGEDLESLRRALVDLGVTIAPVAADLRRLLSAGASVVVEGTQGYGLGLHAGHYPFVTSTDCRAIDCLAQAGISPWQWVGTANGGYCGFRIWVVVRPYPIRVAGNSGLLHDETTWEELGLPAEITTVTHKVRRVGKWDPELVRDAVRANGGGFDGEVVWPGGFGPVVVALTMADQVVPEVVEIGEITDLTADHTDQLDQLVNIVESDAGARVALVTTSPNTGLWLM